MKNLAKNLTKLFIMAFVVLIAGFTTKVYAVSGIPQVDRIAAEYAGVREGETQTFDLLSKSSCNIQYRVWICNKNDKVWKDITNGFTPPMQPKSVYSVRTPKLKEGQYTISVWVKRYGVSNTLDKRGFDNYLATNMNCLKDDGKGPYLTIDNFTHNYEVGQTVSISNKNGTNYLYNYNVYDLINRRNVTTSETYKDTVQWKPSKEGLYLLKVNIKNTEKVPVEVEEKVEQKEETEENNTKLDDVDNKEKDTKEQQDKKNDEKEENKEPDKKEEVKENINDTKETDKKVVKNIEYKEVEKNTTTFRLIAVGNPYRELILAAQAKQAKQAPSRTVSSVKGSNVIHVKSLVVGNVNEGQTIYVKSSPSPRASNVGYFYGSLQGVDILKTVGNYYYIQTKDYKSLNNVKGYVLKSQLKTIRPNQNYSITVKLGQQKVYVYKGDSLIKTFTCSTGRDSTPTPTGVYVIGSRGSLFYSGSSVVCYNWVRWNHNFLFHSVLYDRSGNLILSEYKKLGTKASHGCIRLPLGDVKWIYNNIPSGTAVVIQK